MERLRIKVWGHNATMQAWCIMCAKTFHEANSACTIYTADGVLGDVCPACLAAGAQNSAEQLRKRIDNLKKLEDLAESIGRMTEWPPVEELRTKREEVQGGFSPSYETDEHGGCVKCGANPETPMHEFRCDGGTKWVS